MSASFGNDRSLPKHVRPAKSSDRGYMRWIQLIVAVLVLCYIIGVYFVFFTGKSDSTLVEFAHASNVHISGKHRHGKQMLNSVAASARHNLRLDNEESTLVRLWNYSFGWAFPISPTPVIDEYEERKKDARPATDSEIQTAKKALNLTEPGSHGQMRYMQWEKGTITWPGVQAFDASTPGDYPKFQSLLERIEKWNPDDPDPPKMFTETLQHFDYSNEHELTLAKQYRDAEIPFKIYNVPQFDAVAEKWDLDFLLNVFEQGASYSVEESNSNHFMYWARKGWKKATEKYVPPTKIISHEVTFEEWLKTALEADEMMYGQAENMNKTHWYFMSNAQKGDRSKSFIGRDLQLFSNGKPNFFIKKPEANKGIQCRMAMRGIIAEAHYDCGRNMILMLRGAKRYVLTPPESCEHVHLIPDPNHPSFRHSVIDWSNVTQARENSFDKVQAIDTIVRTGEVLYVPSYWMHYIISTDMSIQCNSRFGPNLEEGAFDPIKRCFDKDQKEGGYFYKPPATEKKQVKNEELKTNEEGEMSFHAKLQEIMGLHAL
eukprot:GSChrysophyteH1.ASY1.ANO1.825.1 assembled CDS